jgi:hypothetical protein
MGRGSDADVTVPHPSVSRRHAELVWEEGGVLSIRDLKSANGTCVNGSTLRDPHRLAEADRIQIGPFTYVFRTFENLEAAQCAVTDDEDAPEFNPTLQAAKQGRNFEGRGLLALCHLLNVRKDDGVLRVRGTIASGEVEFRAGDIVRGELGTLRGEDAVRALLKQQNGYYQLTGSGSGGEELRRLFRSTAAFLSTLQVERDRDLFGFMALDQTQSD